MEGRVEVQVDRRGGHDSEEGQATLLPLAEEEAEAEAIGGVRRGIPRLPEVVEFLTAHGREDIARALA